MCPLRKFPSGPPSACKPAPSGCRRGRGAFTFALALILAGCTSADIASLEARDTEPAARCAKDVDITIDPSTAFSQAIAFDVGKSDLRGGDRIVITEVRGTRSDFATGGTYLVRGRYTLASADQATLLFSVTATHPDEGCTHGNPRGSITVGRGSGTFELATPMPYAGYPHVSFYVEGHGAGGVYFGKGDTLER